MAQKAQLGIDLYFLSGLIEEQDVEEINVVFNDIGLRVIDRNGVFVANAEDFSNVVSLVIDTSLYMSILKEVWPNALWDAIKYASKLLWNKSRNKSYTKVTRGKTEEKQVTVGIVVNIDPATNYNFRFEGLNTEEQLSIALDKTFEFLKERQEQTHKYTTYLGKYNSNEGQWELRDLLQEIRDKLEKEMQDK